MVEVDYHLSGNRKVDFFSIVVLGRRWQVHINISYMYTKELKEVIKSAYSP